MVLMTMNAPPVISMRRVAVGYGERPTLRGIDFRLDAGEVVALVGPNGSGKTTLVRGVLGLAQILGGELELFGIPAAHFHERYRLGYVPQRHTVGGAIASTVREVVASGRLPRKRWFARMGPDDRAAVSQAISTVGLQAHTCSSVSHLSGGQQRRALIARALASEPDVLIMDEPTAGVDAENQASLVQTLGRLVQQGLTLLVVTHEIAPLCPILTRVVTLDAGRLVRDVPIEQDATYHHDAGHDLDHAAPEAMDRQPWLGTAGVG